MRDALMTANSWRVRYETISSEYTYNIIAYVRAYMCVTLGLCLSLSLSLSMWPFAFAQSATAISMYINSLPVSVTADEPQT